MKVRATRPLHPLMGCMRGREAASHKFGGAGIGQGWVEGIGGIAGRMACRAQGRHRRLFGGGGNGGEEGSTHCTRPHTTHYLHACVPPPPPLTLPACTPLYLQLALQGELQLLSYGEEHLGLPRGQALADGAPQQGEGAGLGA